MCGARCTGGKGSSLLRFDLTSQTAMLHFFLLGSTKMSGSGAECGFDPPT